jgi:hypothetical protein
VGGSEAQKGLGSGFYFFSDIFYRVFELPLPRNAQKRDKKEIREKVGFGLLVEFFVKPFDTDFLPKYLYGVFELPLPRNAQKRTKKKAKKKKVGWWVGGSAI